MAVASVYLNGVNFGQGRMGLEEILAKIDTSGIERQAEKISAKAAFDVLVVGGGPAGASAAISAARKGIRTGVAAERFGGPVQIGRAHVWTPVTNAQLLCRLLL